MDLRYRRGFVGFCISFLLLLLTTSTAFSQPNDSVQTQDESSGDSDTANAEDIDSLGQSGEAHSDQASDDNRYVYLDMQGFNRMVDSLVASRIRESWEGRSAEYRPNYVFSNTPEELKRDFQIADEVLNHLHSGLDAFNFASTWADYERKLSGLANIARYRQFDNKIDEINGTLRDFTDGKELELKPDAFPTIGSLAYTVSTWAVAWMFKVTGNKDEKKLFGEVKKNLTEVMQSLVYAQEVDQRIGRTAWLLEALNDDSKTQLKRIDTLLKKRYEWLDIAYEGDQEESWSAKFDSATTSRFENLTDIPEPKMRWLPVYFSQVQRAHDDYQALLERCYHYFDKVKEELDGISKDLGKQGRYKGFIVREDMLREVESQKDELEKLRDTFRKWAIGHSRKVESLALGK